MTEDVEAIVAALRQQVVASSDEKLALEHVKRWAIPDEIASDGNGQPSSELLDRFLVLLKTRTYRQRKARAAWVEQWTNAYDALWYELEGSRLAEFERLVAQSTLEGRVGPAERIENAWAYLGKHEAIGSLGALKSMGLALSGLADTAIWLAWAQTGKPLGIFLEQMGFASSEAPSLTPYLSKSFDETAQCFAGLLDIDLAEKDFRESFSTGELGGRVIGVLMLAGVGGGGAGPAMKTGAEILGTVGSAKGMEDSARKISSTIDRLLQADPPRTLGQILANEELLGEFSRLLTNALGVVGGFGDAAPVLAKTMERFGLLLEGVQLAPAIGDLLRHYNDPALAANPAARDFALKSDAADILGIVLSTVGTKYDARYSQPGSPSPRNELTAGVVGPERQLTAGVVGPERQHSVLGRQVEIRTERVTLPRPSGGRSQSHAEPGWTGSSSDPVEPILGTSPWRDAERRAEVEAMFKSVQQRGTEGLTEAALELDLEAFSTHENRPPPRVSPVQQGVNRGAFKGRMRQSVMAPKWATSDRDWNPHHVLPVEWENHEVLEILRANGGWDHHDAKVNGYPLPTRPGISGAENLPVHQIIGGVSKDLAGHPQWNSERKRELDALATQRSKENPDTLLIENPSELRSAVMELIVKLKGDLETAKSTGNNVLL